MMESSDKHIILCKDEIELICLSNLSVYLIHVVTSELLQSKLFCTDFHVLTTYNNEQFNLSYELLCE